MADKLLKIAQVITRMDKGGSSDIVRDLTSRLSNNYEVKLIYGPTQNPSQATTDFLRAYRKNTICLPVLRREINPFYDVLAIFMLWRIFRKERFDIVHCHTSKAGFLGRIAARLAGVKLIIYMPHGHVFYGYFGELKTRLIINAERFAARYCNTIITLTNLEKSDFERLKIAPKEKIKVIVPGIDFNALSKFNETKRIETRRALKINDNEIAIGFVSRLETVKGTGIFLESAAIITKKNTGIKFIVCGDGALKARVLETQDALGSRLMFLGWREDNLNIINALDILIQPSLNEAVGLNIIEAQALNVAVVATRVGGIPEIIFDGNTGLLCTPNADEVADAVQRLLDNPKFRITIAANGHANALKRFDFARMFGDIEKIYKSIAL
jgi:glycosyltransferase involved in cell wall biosynthesis